MSEIEDRRNPRRMYAKNEARKPAIDLETAARAALTAPGHTDLMVAPETLDAFMEANPLPPDPAAIRRAALEEAATHLDAIAAATPLGHEDRQRGASTYNWLRTHAAAIRALAEKEAPVATFGSPPSEQREGRPAYERAAMITQRMGQPLAEKEPTDAWQPIETAPKDGRPVLVFDANDGGMIFVASWEPSLEKMYRRPGYGWRSVACAEDYFTGVNVTHWMPLPERPR